MRIIRDPYFIDPTDRGAAVAIGNFDGVHLGHQAVIDVARKAAADKGVPLGILTFEPHPRAALGVALVGCGSDVVDRGRTWSNAGASRHEQAGQHAQRRA